MKKLLIVLLLISVSACKTDTKEQNNSQAAIEKPVNEFIVKLNYKTNHKDEFKLSLGNVKVDEFQRKNIQIIEKVSKTTSIDKIVANFGENFSKKFNISFGGKKVKEIEIQSIELTYGKNNLIVGPSDLEKYFRLSKYITLDSINNTLKTQKVDGRHLPLIYLRQNAINTLKKGVK